MKQKRMEYRLALFCLCIILPATAFAVQGQEDVTLEGIQIPLFVPAGAVEQVQEEMEETETTELAGMVETPLFEFAVEGQEVSLTSYLGEDDEVIVPDILDGMPVTAIAENAFLENKIIRHITLPDTVISIGRSAFEDMTALTGITLPPKLTRIGDYAFKGCEALEEITLPLLLESIGYAAFQRCTSIRKVEIPERVLRIGGRAFDRCNQLENVVIPPSVTSIGGRAFRSTPWLEAQKDPFVIINDSILIKYNGTDFVVDVPAEVKSIAGAFDDCSWISEIHLPEGLETINEYSFSGCTSLMDIALPESLTVLGSFAFQESKSLERIAVPAGVTRIGEASFGDCISLKEVQLPSTLTSISGRAFQNCTALLSIALPYSVQSVNDTAFEGCDKNLVISAVQGSEAEAFAMRMEWQLEYNQFIEDQFVYSANTEEAVIIHYAGDRVVLDVPASLGGKPIGFIAEDAFAGNSTLRSVLFPETLTGIGDRAFSECDVLQTLTFPEGLSIIGKRAFQNCDALKTVYLPPSVTEIGVDAFAGCDGLVLTVQMESHAARYAQENGLPAVALEESLGDFTLEVGESDTLTLIGYTGSRRALTLPNKQHGMPIVTVATKAFAGNSNLLVVHVPEGYLTVESRAFADISGELTITLPDSLISIAPDAFDGSTVTLQGYAGSAAEAYAREHGLRFLVQR